MSLKGSPPPKKPPTPSPKVKSIKTVAPAKKSAPTGPAKGKSLNKGR